MTQEIDIFAALESEEPEELQIIVKSLLRLGAEHWQHDYILKDGAPPVWLQKTYKHLHDLHEGTFGAIFYHIFLGKSWSKIYR